MSKRIVQAFANIKKQDRLVVIGRTAKPHALEDIKIGRRGKVKIVPRKLSSAG